MPRLLFTKNDKYLVGNLMYKAQTCHSNRIGGVETDTDKATMFSSDYMTANQQLTADEFKLA